MTTISASAETAPAPLLAKPQLAEWVLAAPLLLATALAPMNRLRLSEHVSYADLALALAFACASLRLSVGQVRPRIPLPLLLPLLLFTVGGLAGAAFLSGGRESLMSLLQFEIAAFIFPLVVAWHAAANPRIVKWMLAAWIAGSVFSGLVGFLSHHNLWSLGFQDIYAHRKRSAYRIAGLSFHPNSLALFTAIVLPLVVNWAVAAGSARVRLLMIVLTLFLLDVLDLTGSRAGLAVALLVVPLQLLISFSTVHGRNATVRFIAIGLGAVCVLAAYEIYVGGSGGSSAIDRLFLGEGTERSDLARETIRDTALATFSGAPVFGAGYQHIRDAHNFFLQFLESGGVIGLTAFVLYLGLLARVGLRLLFTFAERQDWRSWLFTISICAGIVSWVLGGLYQNAVVERAVYLPVALLLGFYFALTNPQDSP